MFLKNLKYISDIASVFMWWNGELMAVHSCRWLNSTWREDLEKHWEHETRLLILCVCIYTYIRVGESVWFSNPGPEFSVSLLFQLHQTKPLAHHPIGARWSSSSASLFIAFITSCAQSHALLILTCWENMMYIIFLQANKNIFSVTFLLPAKAVENN